MQVCFFIQRIFFDTGLMGELWHFPCKAYCSIPMAQSPVFIAQGVN